MDINCILTVWNTPGKAGTGGSFPAGLLNTEVIHTFSRNPTTEQAVCAKNDPEYRNAFIDRNRIFIRITAARTVHHFVSEHDDEWSVAMVAFNEAIEKYEPDRGSFSSFAANVIRNRLTDKLRRDYRYAPEILFDPADLERSRKTEDLPDALSIEVAKKLEAEAVQPENRMQVQAREEIEAVQQLLAPYGFCFYDLVSCSPKAEKTKAECAQAVIVLLEDDDLFASMRSTRTLPSEGILKASGVKKKILERHRRYIIAVAEILHGEYPLLAGYMEYIRKQIPHGHRGTAL